MKVQLQMDEKLEKSEVPEMVCRIQTPEGLRLREVRSPE
jgi:hypothetical protein